MNSNVVAFNKAIQEAERLIQTLSTACIDTTIIQQTKETLRQQKSQYQGTESPIQDDPNFGQSLKHSKKSFLQLKSLIKGNTLSELRKHPHIVDTIIHELRTALGNNHELIYASHMCSPWFSFTQDDRQSKSRKNTLFFVFRHHSSLRLGIDNQHSVFRQELFSVDGADEWIVGREIRSFIDLALKSQHRYIAALSNDENILYQTDIWRSLREITEKGAVFYKTKQFIQKTTSQGIAKISVKDKKGKAKKGKKARKYLNEIHILSSEAQQDASLFCECFYLIFDVARVCLGKDLLDWVEWERETISPDENITKPELLTEETLSILLSKYEKLIRYHLAETAYKCNQHSDFLLFRCALELVEILDEFQRPLIKDIPFNATIGYEKILESWMGKVREQSLLSDLRGDVFPVSFDIVRFNEHQVDQSGLIEIMKDIGRPLLNYEPYQILFLIENGSRMYDVAMPDSDRDYIAIYQSNCSSILSNIQWPKESQDNRGFQFEVEHCCYEIRMYCELLLKGNPSVIELLYSDRVTYMTEAWKQLVEHRDEFISEEVVFQYISWVRFHLGLIKKGKNPVKARKYLYHAFHKLFELERLLNREPIQVKVIGEEREFILRVRQSNDDSGEFSIENLTNLATTRLTYLQEKMVNREWRYPESGNWKFLHQWILSVRYSSYNTNDST